MYCMYSLYCLICLNLFVFSSIFLANYLMVASWIATIGSAGSLPYFLKMEHDDVWCVCRYETHHSNSGWEWIWQCKMTHKSWKTCQNTLQIINNLFQKRSMSYFNDYGLTISPWICWIMCLMQKKPWLSSAEQDHLLEFYRYLVSNHKSKQLIKPNQIKFSGGGVQLW